MNQMLHFIHRFHFIAAYNVAKALGIRKAEVYSLSSSRGLSEKVDFTVKVDEAPPAPAKIDQVPSNEN